MTTFSIQIEPQFGFQLPEIVKIALLCEEVGFNSLWCSDHFFLDNESSQRDCWECWTLLSVLAVETKKIRIGPLVSCISYRHPAVLAKMSACVDELSGGRLNMGIGAGWKTMEYEAYGIPFPSSRERVKRLEEGVQIIKQMWTEDEASFHGEYYEINHAYCSPKPRQNPHPPVWIGGERPKVLDIAARFADGINIGSHPSLERYVSRMKILKEACQQHGRDFDSIEKSHFLEVATASDNSALDTLLRDMARKAGKSFNRFRTEYGGYVGTPDQISNFLKQLMQLGFDHFFLVFL